MKKAVPFIAATALLWTLEASALEANCESECTVVITMSAGCGSGIKVAPDPVVVKSGATPTISWVIQSNNWQFAENGIVIEQAGPAAFERSQAGGGKNVKIRHFNDKKNPRAYKYDINLTGPGGTCTLDPTIVDQ